MEENDKKVKEKKREIITCRFPENKVNSEAAKSWMKTCVRPGMGKALGRNKRTILRIFGD